MERTALDLMEYFKARAAYTFSDEITLALVPTLTTSPPFGGKVAKIISIASGTRMNPTYARQSTIANTSTHRFRLCPIQPSHQLARVSSP
jgi:tRNA(His) 5'-end guanylyltransferase